MIHPPPAPPSREGGKRKAKRRIIHADAQRMRRRERQRELSTDYADLAQII